MLLTISVTVIAGIMVVAVIFQIPFILQLRRTAREAEKILETARLHIAPLSHDLTVVSHEVSGILQSVHRHVDRLEESITTIRDSTERLREFEEDILRRIEVPLLEVASLISAMSRGIEAFVRVLRR